MAQADDFKIYLEDLPLLHSWDGGETWNTGGFNPRHLQVVFDHLVAHAPANPAIVETGAGNSTLTFLHLDPRRLVAIAPAADLRDRILDYCQSHGLDSSGLDFRVDRSELVLPPLAFDGAVFDVALIDGGHGWPTVFVDFCYMSMMLRRGGILVLDDLQIHSVAELSRLLAEQPEFELAEDLGKLQLWHKTTDRPFLPEHSRQPYILSKTRRRGDA